MSQNCPSAEPTRVTASMRSVNSAIATAMKIVRIDLPLCAFPKLVGRRHRLAVREVDLDHLLTLDRRPVLVLKRRDDLLGPDVDQIASRRKSRLAVQAERDPARL